MLASEIIRRVKEIQVRTGRHVADVLAGEYVSVFKGGGIEFDEVRPYIPGDDIRMIDWNVTARCNAPFVKILEEERELTVYLLVDVSRSGHFGTVDHFKSELAAEIAAVLGFSAVKNKDKVGLILFSDHVEKYIPPKKDRSHILRVVREVLFHQPEGTGTSLESGLDFLMNVAKRKAVVFLISDFLDEGYWKSLKLANRKHDMIGIRIADPAEKNLPDMGLIKVHDSETGDMFWADLSSTEERNAFSQSITNKWETFENECGRSRLDVINVGTDADFVEPLMTYFQRREKRY